MTLSLRRLRARLSARQLGASLLCALCLLLAPRRAAAYPQFVFKGYGDCSSCHHSPTGGGLPNRWGRESLDVSFDGDGGLTPGHADLTYDAAAPAVPKVDLGADARLLPLFGSDGDGSLGPTVVPMLTELGGALAYGPLTAYGTVTARKLTGTGLPFVLFSREHWLKLHIGGGLDVRAGRLVLPFGLHQPDHTQYVREDFGFDKYDQSYAAEVDFNGHSWHVFGSAFVGDLTLPTRRQERGVAASVLRDFEGGAALGVSALGSMSDARTRVAGSLFARWPLGSGTYLLGEAALQNVDARWSSARYATIAEYLRLGWFVRPPLDLYLELGQRSFLAASGLSKARAGIGLNWQLWRWFELAPQVLAEVRTGLPTRVLALAQLHLLY